MVGLGTTVKRTPRKIQNKETLWGEWEWVFLMYKNDSENCQQQYKGIPIPWGNHSIKYQHVGPLDGDESSRCHWSLDTGLPWSVDKTWLVHLIQTRMASIAPQVFQTFFVAQKIHKWLILTARLLNCTPHNTLHLYLKKYTNCWFWWHDFAGHIILCICKITQLVDFDDTGCRIVGHSFRWGPILSIGHCGRPNTTNQQFCPRWICTDCTIQSSCTWRWIPPGGSENLTNRLNNRKVYCVLTYFWPKIWTLHGQTSKLSRTYIMWPIKTCARGALSQYEKTN